jgi:hypothetical protein
LLSQQCRICTWWQALKRISLCEWLAWSAYRTEFYATYDYAPIAEHERKKPAK